MKKRILGVAFGVALLFGGFGLSTQNAEAHEKEGFFDPGDVRGHQNDNNGVNENWRSIICDGTGSFICRFEDRTIKKQ